MASPYLGYRNEGEYHEHYTLLGLLERETDRAERRSIKKRLREIEAAMTPPNPHTPGCREER